MKILQALVLCTLTYFNTHTSQKAVINVPIADLLGQSIITMRPNESPHTAYHAIALCGGQINSTYACPRLHQLLYNDIIDVIKTTDDEAQIRIAHAYYVVPSAFAKATADRSADRQAQYWILKSNITLFDDLTAHNIPTAHLPNPINFSDKSHHALKHPDVVTLTEPHHDTTLHTTFSVGTRFTRVPLPQKKRPSYITVFAIDYKTMQEHQIKIPSYKCMIADPTKTKTEQITDYVNLLKKWAHTKHGCIPYTWGGTSFAHTIHGNFKEVTHKTNNSDYSSYEYEKDTNSPKSGFDCSGAIARATQICGIPYFCKNTATIPHCLAPLKPDQVLTNGDLILIRGHVMVVSDTDKNLLIEARSYSHGYGKLHEIPIGKVFEEIETYKDLTDAYFGKKVIKRKDKQGKIRDTFTNLQLFSMASVLK